MQPLSYRYIDVLRCFVKESKEGRAQPELECLYGWVLGELVDYVVVSVVTVVTFEFDVDVVVGDRCGAEDNVASVDREVC